MERLIPCCFRTKFSSLTPPATALSLESPSWQPPLSRTRNAPDLLSFSACSLMTRHQHLLFPSSNCQAPVTQFPHHPATQCWIGAKSPLTTSKMEHSFHSWWFLSLPFLSLLHPTC